MATTQTEIGLNRTGIGTSPKLTEAMLKGTDEFLPNTTGDESVIAKVRQDYAKDAGPLGSVTIAARPCEQLRRISGEAPGPAAPA